MAFLKKKGGFFAPKGANYFLYPFFGTFCRGGGLAFLKIFYGLVSFFSFFFCFLLSNLKIKSLKNLAFKDFKFNVWNWGQGFNFSRIQYFFRAGGIEAQKKRLAQWGEKRPIFFIGHYSFLFLFDFIVFKSGDLAKGGQVTRKKKAWS